MSHTEDTSIPPAMDVEAEPEDCSGALRRSFIQEWKVLEDLVAAMVQNRGYVEMSAVKRAQLIMEKYQEQGQLLEPHLESIVGPLMHILQVQAIQAGDPSVVDIDVVKKICSIIHTLVTVCGYKTVTKFFPHQALDLELAVALLERCHKEIPETSILREESTGQWETKCILLLWLSILVLIPFDMVSIDTALANSESSTPVETTPLVSRMVRICKDYLSSPGPMREMAGILLSRLLTRPDMQHTLHCFIQWTKVALSGALSDPTAVFLVPGIVGAVAAIFKVGGRESLLHVAATAWEEACEITKSSSVARNSLLRKLLVKLVQRIGLTFLPPRVATWRYKGVDSLIGKNLSTTPSTQLNSQFTDNEVDSRKKNLDTRPNLENIGHSHVSANSEGEQFDVPEVVEDIIGQLLTGLKDKDTVVRWSAAKGIGRVTGRLSSIFGDDVVTSVLELFCQTEGDGAWHGGCLALAELARRGLLPPECLPKVIPVIVKALHYDIRRGPHSVGAHVRDAAAYVCWAFARAYSPTLMREHLKQLAPALLTISCYDREVNCRRAASAAFQENVGRQGNFAHGIDLVNAADYFSLATRTNAYRTVAVYVAQFEDYRMPLIKELLHSKISHWDRGIRELAAEALALLVKYDTTYFGGPVLDMLLPWTLSKDLNLRHGATLAIAEVILALSSNGFSFSPEKEKTLGGIVPGIEKARLYRGKGGEIMRLAVSRLIECTALAQLRLSKKAQKEILDTINENLKHPNGQIQANAVGALKAFTNSYMSPANAENVEKVTSKHMQILQSDPNPAARRGSALAFSALSSSFLVPVWKDVLDTLCSACVIEENPDDRDAETRVNAVRGLVAVCESLFIDGKEFLYSTAMKYNHPALVMKGQVMDYLFNSLDDYAVDNRGDVGSWVREAAMEGIERCIYILCKAQIMLEKELTTQRSEEKLKEEKGKVEAKSLDLQSSSKSDFLSYPGEQLFDANLAIKVIGGLVKQAMEKIDRVRDVAGRTLQSIIHNKRIDVPFIPHKTELEQIVPEDKNFNWGVPADTIPRLVPLLKFPEYRFFVISGLVISIGGLADSLGKVSLKALLNFLQDNGDSVTDCVGAQLLNSIVTVGDQRDWLGTELVLILNTYASLDRVITPTFKTIDILFSKGVFSSPQDTMQSFALGVLRSLKSELKGSKDVVKLFAGINVIGHLTLMQEPAGSQSLFQLLTLLGHRYPKVRKACAEQIYLLLVQKGEEILSGEDLNIVLELVSETSWEGPLESIRNEREKLFSLFKMRTLVSPTDEKEQISRQIIHKVQDENASYAALVNDSSRF